MAMTFLQYVNGTQLENLIHSFFYHGVNLICFIGNQLMKFLNLMSLIMDQMKSI